MSAPAPALGRPLERPPSDGVSSLSFSSSSDLLLCSSWEGSARLYDAPRNHVRASYSQQAPVLDAAFQDDSHVFLAGLDGIVKRYDFFARQEAGVGQHGGGVRCVEWLPERGLLATGSWDRTVCCWDPRIPKGSNRAAQMRLPGKVFSMSCAGQRMVVATSSRHVLIYDIRKLESGLPESERESSLRYQTRCLRCYPDATGYAMGSVEGRVAMEYFDMSETVQARRYAFKCHRKSDTGKDTVYPVNAIAFHPIHGTFASGGGDGTVNIWDGQNKKRLCQMPGYQTSISALAFSKDGRHLAIAASYTWEFGEQEHPADAVYIRQIHDVEVKPKPRT
ncbi:g10880 [Coccomyxa viridis]|uniref:G10880 protein n=1 Tax=Coccomyxa viridis TaxID=1274662 RepID=A0ABP1GDJ9_9CHLO